jgi:hypothetical protein
MKSKYKNKVTKLDINLNKSKINWDFILIYLFYLKYVFLI